MVALESKEKFEETFKILGPEGCDLAGDLGSKSFGELICCIQLMTSDVPSLIAPIIRLSRKQIRMVVSGEKLIRIRTAQTICLT